MNIQKTFPGLLIGIFLMSFAVFAQAQSVGSTNDNLRNRTFTERGQSVYTLNYPTMNRIMIADLQSFESENSIMSVVIDENTNNVTIKTSEDQVPMAKFQALVDAYLAGKARGRNLVEEAN